MDQIATAAFPKERSWGWSLLAPLGALVIWGALIAAAHLSGSGLAAELRERGVNMKLGAPPLFGRFEVSLPWQVVLPVIVAGVSIAFAARVAHTLSWSRLLLTSFVISLAWGVSLALADGTLVAPLEARPDYLAALPRIGDIGNFVQTFGERLAQWPVHVEGHPPGMVVMLWGLARVGLGGPGPAAAVIIAAGSSIAAATLITVRSIAGEEPARRAAPFLVLAPFALWLATSADGLFAGVIAWSIAVFVLACEATTKKGIALGAIAGLLFGCALFFTYGAAPLGLVLVSVAIVKRAVVPSIAAGAGVLAVALAWAAAGFWWFDGLAATLARYGSGVASNRPMSYFVWANLAAFALALGPAAALGAAFFRRSRLSWVLGAAAASLLLADLSGFSKGEVERIWLPFAPWILILAAFIPRRLLVPALAGQALLAIALQTFVSLPW